MKKLTVILLALLMVAALAACSGNHAGIGSDPLASDFGSGRPGENQDKHFDSTESDHSDRFQTENDHNLSEENRSDMGNVLVAYFSATNTTEGVAKTIADILGADLYEITPEQPYTDADLNYRDNNSRSTVEMNDPNARPAISGSVENMEQYDIVFIGYPIWWGEAPRILSTFVEHYDFSGKTVVPFCTSGGSGVGSSASNLARLTSGAVWLSGARLNGNASRSSVEEWIRDLGLDIAAR